MVLEAERVAALRGAERQALALFDEVVDAGLVRPGRSEQEISDDVRDLAHERYGVDRHWHKRIVRSGPNTIEPYRANPPDRRLQDDDIAFLDFGPVFGDWEADVGRTIVLGEDPAKHRLAEALPEIWRETKGHFDAHAEITGDELFGHFRTILDRDGWGHGAVHAGHRVGEFPHHEVGNDRVGDYITAGNDRPMRRLDAGGRPCHWILEVHLIDHSGAFGGFVEQLLDI